VACKGRTKLMAGVTRLIVFSVYAMTVVISPGASASNSGCINGSALLRGDFNPTPGPAARKQRLTACDDYVYTQMAFLFPENYGLVSLDNLSEPLFKDLSIEKQFFILTKISLQSAENVVSDAGKFGLEFQNLGIQKVVSLATQLHDKAPELQVFGPDRRAHYLRVLAALSTHPVVLIDGKAQGLFFEVGSPVHSETLRSYCFVRSDIASVGVEEVTGSPLFASCMSGARD
jgi:hypothetical protein